MQEKLLSPAFIFFFTAVKWKLSWNFSVLLLPWASPPEVRTAMERPTPIFVGSDVWWAMFPAGAGRRNTQRSGKEQSAAAPGLSVPQERHSWRRRLYRAPSHRHPPSTARSNNSTKYTSGPDQPPAVDIYRETLHMTLVCCYTGPVCTNVLILTTTILTFWAVNELLI